MRKHLLGFNKNNFIINVSFKKSRSYYFSMTQNNLQNNATFLLKLYENRLSSNNSELQQLSKISLGKQIQAMPITQTQLNNIQKFKDDIKESMNILSALQNQKMNFIEKPLNYSQQLLNYLITKLTILAQQKAIDNIEIQQVSATDNQEQIQQVTKNMLILINNIIDQYQKLNNYQYDITKYQILYFFIQKYQEVKKDNIKQLYLIAAAIIIKNDNIMDEDIENVDFEFQDTNDLTQIQEFLDQQLQFSVNQDINKLSPDFQLCCKLYCSFNSIDEFKTIFVSKISNQSVTSQKELLIQMFLGIVRQNLAVEFTTNGVLTQNFVQLITWISKYVTVNISFQYTQKQQEYAYLLDKTAEEQYLITKGESIPHINYENVYDTFIIGQFLDTPQTLSVSIRNLLIFGAVNTDSYILTGQWNNLVSISLQNCQWIKIKSLQSLLLLRVTGVSGFEPSNLQQTTKLQQLYVHKCTLSQQYDSADIATPIINNIPNENKIKIMSIKWCSTSEIIRLAKPFPHLQKLNIWASNGLNRVYIDLDVVNSQNIQKISIGSASLVLKGIFNKQSLENVQANSLEEIKS